MIDPSRWQVAPPIRAEALGHLIATDSRGEMSEKNFLKRVSETAAQWGRSDPVAAAEWVTSLPPGEAREWAGRNVAWEWADLSEREAEAWVAGLENAAERALLQEVLAER